jgi:hypothetical protein
MLSIWSCPQRRCCHERAQHRSVSHVCPAYSEHMLMICCSCDIDVNGGQMCGQVFANQPSVCTLHTLSICSNTDAYTRSFVISAMNTQVPVSSRTTHAEHTLNTCQVLNPTTVNITQAVRIAGEKQVLRIFPAYAELMDPQCYQTVCSVWRLA